VVEDENDPVSKYCLKMLQNPQICVSTATVNVVLTELAEMCCVFQQSCIMPLEAFEFAMAKILKLRVLYLKKIVHFNPEVKTVMASIGFEVNNDAVLWFVERVCNHLEDQFPDGELKEWVAFEISVLQNSQQDYLFDNEEIHNLESKYANILKYLPISQTHDQGFAE